MKTQVMNDGSCIRIINDDTPFIINKGQIKTIDAVRNEMVRIDIGEGPLRHIFITFADVIAPAGLADASALRDAIKAMLDGSGIGSADLTPITAAIQAEGGKIDNVTAAVNALGQQLTTSDTNQTQNLTVIKQSVDALGAAIANISPSTELQIIHDQIVTNGSNITNAVQSLIQQLSGSGATQASFLASIQAATENIGATLTSANLAAGLQSIHDQIVTNGTNEATLLGNIAQAIITLHAAQVASNALMYPTRIDDSLGNIIYNGYTAGTGLASPSTADPIWAIQRVTADGRGQYVYEWANGNQQYTNIWDNRANLTYTALGATPAA